MENYPKTLALAATGLMVLGGSPVAAQSPGLPGGITPFGEAMPDPVPKSDEHRIVGKVLKIDRDRGLVTLATEDAVVVVEPRGPVLDAMRVGDTVTVPRSDSESPSALPRE
jgi:hypothetical protein